jgi:hypothetical protein
MRFIFIAACLSNLRRAYASGLTATTADAVFGCEQFNSTGGTRTRVGPSFTGAHDPKLSDGGVRRGTCMASGKAAVEAGAVTRGAVRCPHS